MAESNDGNDIAQSITLSSKQDDEHCATSPSIKKVIKTQSNLPDLAIENVDSISSSTVHNLTVSSQILHNSPLNIQLDTPLDPFSSMMNNTLTKLGIQVTKSTLS
jgi:hypothetical protein